VSTEEDIDAVALAMLRFGGSTKACEKVGARPLTLPQLAQELAYPQELSTAELGEQMRTARRWALRALDAAHRAGLTFLPIRSPGYPEWLARIHDPPIGLWTKGTVAPPEKSVAIVGSRLASPAGLNVARTLGRDLAEAGWTIVSGMALGVDGAAHVGALEGGGATIAVLGCGADVVYPYQHRALADRIVAHGCILSEFVPGTPPQPWQFPVRNRIISGLSRAVIVVEASKQSGSLITARLAMDQGRDVLVVPGTVASGRSSGGHGLIKDGACLVENVDDVLDELEGVSREKAATPAQGRLLLSELEEKMAKGDLYGVDDLASLSGRSAADLLAELSALEMQGRVVRVGGGNFIRRDPSDHRRKGK
jgi:DNA processing protein